MDEGQRLVRVLCPSCKKASAPTPEDEALWDRLVAPWKANRPAQFYHPVGCLDCRMTGYRGRIGLYEILLLSQDVKQAIADNAEVARIRDLSYREGMKPLPSGPRMSSRSVSCRLASIAVPLPTTR